MAIERVSTFLQSHRRVALDSCIFIYQWEAHPRYSPLTDQVFSSMEDSHFVGVTSTVTMTELLVHPYRDKDVTRVNELLSLLPAYPNLLWIAPTLQIADRAAEIRAVHRLRTPDALQAGATALVTNDPTFKRISDFEVLILDDLL